MTKTYAGPLARHLNEDQVNEAMIGCLSAESEGHLDACALCQERLAMARLPIENFKALTLAWSERRSATMPVPAHVSLLASLNHRRRLAWGSAVVALLVVTIATPIELRHAQRREADDAAQAHSVSALGATGVVSGQQSTEEQIARDNQLLNEIDRELNSSHENPADLGLETVQERTNHHVAVRAVQD